MVSSGALLRPKEREGNPVDVLWGAARILGDFPLACENDGLPWEELPSCFPGCPRLCFCERREPGTGTAFLKFPARAHGGAAEPWREGAAVLSEGRGRQRGRTLPGPGHHSHPRGGVPTPGSPPPRGAPTPPRGALRCPLPRSSCKRVFVLITFREPGSGDGAALELPGPCPLTRATALASRCEWQEGGHPS